MRFTLDVCELLQLILTSEPGSTVKRQLAKSATSVGANYRAACRARSHAEFTARTVVAEEADETVYWLDVMAGARREARELLAIFSSAVGTARRNARTAGS
jgi:four helix bundle protein